MTVVIVHIRLLASLQEKECEVASKRVRDYIHQMVEGVRGEGQNEDKERQLDKEGMAFKNGHNDVPNLLAKLVHAKEAAHDDRNALSPQEVDSGNFLSLERHWEGNFDNVSYFFLLFHFVPQVFANTMTILLAGSDTTSTTIAWTLYLLLKNPAVVKKAQKEVDSVFAKDDVPSTEQLSQLKYIYAILQESLRLKVVIVAAFDELPAVVVQIDDVGVNNNDSNCHYSYVDGEQGTATFLPLQCLQNSTVIDGVKLNRGEAVFPMLRYTSMKNGGGPEFNPDRWVRIYRSLVLSLSRSLSHTLAWIMKNCLASNSWRTSKPARRHTLRLVMARGSAQGRSWPRSKRRCS